MVVFHGKLLVITRWYRSTWQVHAGKMMKNQWIFSRQALAGQDQLQRKCNEFAAWWFFTYPSEK